MNAGGASSRRPFAFDPANGVVFGVLDVGCCYRCHMPYSGALYRRELCHTGSP
jgi:hypothetical protein